MRQLGKQYHFRAADPGFDARDVDRLIELSRGRPVPAVAVASVGGVDTGIGPVQ